MLTKRTALCFLVLSTILLVAGLAFASSAALAGDPLGGSDVPPALAEEFTDKILARLRGAAEYEVQSLLFQTQVEDIALSADATWAIAWMAPVDRATGEVLAVEPGLAILRVIDGEWTPVLPLDAAWRDWLAGLPEE
jgi:hypothetical protein